MPKSYSPLRYPGGKSQFFDKVKCIFDANDAHFSNYLEPYAGGAGVALRLLFEGLVETIYINDADFCIYCFWFAATKHTNWLVNKIVSTEISIEEWKRQRFIYLHANQFSKREVGFSVLFLNRCNRSGILKAGPIGGLEQKGTYKINCRFNKEKLISLIRMIEFYKNRIFISNLDAIDFIITYKNLQSSFWFIDPPYFFKGKELYKNFYKIDDHRDLSKIIKKHLTDSQWILTYDVSSEIFELYKSFKYKMIELNYSVETKRKETEYLFYNNLLIEGAI